MKQAFLLLSILLTLNVLAQTPDYFSNEPVWREYWINAVSSECLFISEKQISISGDTVMSNGISYKNLYSTSLNSGCDQPSSSYHGFYAAVRQSNDSIFEYNTWDNEEVLVLHYNFQVGDTLQGAFYYDDWYFEPIQVIGIDSIETLNGIHRRFSLSPTFNSNPEYMVEGVGSNFGFLNGIGIMLNGTRDLVCYRQNGIYQYGPDTTCAVISSLPEIDLFEFNVYPNPANDNLTTIESDFLRDIGETIISLRSIDGKLIKRIRHLENSGNSWSIDLSEVPTGVYILSLQSKSAMANRKLIVE